MRALGLLYIWILNALACIPRMVGAIATNDCALLLLIKKMFQYRKR